MPLTHLDAEGRAAMVDIGGKPVTDRSAIARGRISMSLETTVAIVEGRVPKGDVLAVARVAGIQAAKATASLIPLCHILSLDAVRIDIDAVPEGGFVVVVNVTCSGRTGVEMEALTAVSVTLLTLYDMTKSMDRGMVIQRIELVEKRGGVRGDWRRDESADGARDQGRTHA